MSGTRARVSIEARDLAFGADVVGRRGLPNTCVVPDALLRTAAASGMGTFKQTVIHPNGDVEFRFNPPAARRPFAKAEEDPAPIVVKADALAGMGLRLDSDRLPAIVG